MPINAGLEKPSANWVKHRERHPRIWLVTRRSGGKRYSRTPSSRGVIAPPRHVCRTHRTHHSPNSPKHDILNLLTARVLCCPPTIPLLHYKRPHCHRGRFRFQQSQATRAAAIPAMPPPVEKMNRTMELDLFLLVFFFWVIFRFILVLSFVCFLHNC